MHPLLRTHRFLPLFITQFLGAFNDNLFKNALVILVTYRLAAADPERSAYLVNLAFGLFMLPTLALSFLAGQTADKFDRALIARRVKLVEISLALIAAIGLYLGSIPLLFATLFGFGAHSAFFGPIKYALLPQHLSRDELMTGNGLVEAGTFLAILTGTILGGLLILLGWGEVFVALAMLATAITGYVASRAIPAAPAPEPQLVIDWHIGRQTGELIRVIRSNRAIWLSVLGISWFWLLGALFLAQFSPLAKHVLHADEHVVTLFLAVFSIGIAIGSLACSKWLRGIVHANHVPLGALGISICALDLYFACNTFATLPRPTDALIGMAGFLSSWAGWRIVTDLFALAVCGGIFIVPLYVMLQVKGEARHGARIIAANNFVNALFMVGAALLGILLVKLGLTIPGIFLTAAILNLGVVVYLTKLLPLSLIGALLKLIYRVEVKGLENYAAAGDRVLIVANHTSFLDAAIIAPCLPDRITFAVNSFIAKRWWLKPLLKLVDAFPIDPTNPMATKALIECLRQNRKVMIFPEGRLTMTGALMKVYEGPGLIADKSGATILPIRIDGAQYSPFSKLKGKLRIRLFPKITITILPPRTFALPDDSKGRKRRALAGAQLYDLMTGMLFDSSPLGTTLTRSLLDARHTHGGSHIIAEDQQRMPLRYDSFVARSYALARAIGKLDSNPALPLGLMLPNTTTTALAFFGIQAAGRVAAMINYTSGPAAILACCRAANIQSIISSRRFIALGKLEPVTEALSAAGVRVIYLEDLPRSLSPFDKGLTLLARIWPGAAYALLPKRQADDAAVILFTSGSEGLPKGVALSHRNILANRYQLASVIDFGPQDIVFNCLPIFHAFGLTGGMLLPLLSGIKVFFYPSPLHYRIVPELIYDSDATILFGTDTFLAGYARFADPYDFYALRYVFAGAEKLKDTTRRTWMERYGIRIFEGYGATETAPVVSVNTAMHYRAGSVGRMLPGQTARLEPVEGIQDGQRLLVRGPNVMLGYLKSDQPGVLQPAVDGWYDTGDIVSISADGFITIKGRAKRFAKIAGEMVSLAAVEDYITAAHPGFQHAVIALPDDRKGEQLILATTQPDLTREAVLAAARAAQHGELMVPRQIVMLAALPLLGSGKTDYVTLTDLLRQQLVKAA